MMAVTTCDLVLTWFPVRENPQGQESLDPPIAQETIRKRRIWTAKRDLIAASNESEVWRIPTSDEELDWHLWEPHEGHIPGNATWLVATTGEPGLGIPTLMAVRLQETLTRD